MRRVRWSQDAVSIATDDAEIEADAVVVAIPTAPLAEIEFDPPLEGATAEALRAVTYGQNSKLFVRLRSPAPPSAIMSVAGHFWTYTQLGADARPAPFVTAYTGTMAAIEDLGGSEGSRAGSPRWSRFARTSSWSLRRRCSRAGTTTRGCGAPTRLAPSPRHCATTIWSKPIGPLFFAGEHTAGEWHGLMEGALRSGRRAAEQVLTA